jgi:hypothetical protein
VRSIDVDWFSSSSKESPARVSCRIHGHDRDASRTRKVRRTSPSPDSAETIGVEVVRDDENLSALP